MAFIVLKAVCILGDHECKNSSFNAIYSPKISKIKPVELFFWPSIHYFKSVFKLIAIDLHSSVFCYRKWINILIVFDDFWWNRKPRSHWIKNWTHSLLQQKNSRGHDGKINLVVWWWTEHIDSFRSFILPSTFLVFFHSQTCNPEFTGCLCALSTNSSQNT